jgi:exodeoxyribonuclease-3
MKLVNWNVNGIRACGKGGFLKWFEGEGADIVCVQEIKAHPDQRDHARLPFKLEFCKKFLKKAESLRKKGENVIMCADWNIAHQEIDLRNPKTNKKNAGFLPEERAWMDQFIKTGYVDAFRQFQPEGGHYTWWSYRPGVREKNVGWRLDYFMANEEFKDRLKTSYHRNDIFGSDHCPVVVELKK